MGATSFVQESFLGGEWSQDAQGRTAPPSPYRTALNVCLNGLPVESGAWRRRPGTRHCGVTRAGLPAKIIPFDFAQAFPQMLEFTDRVLLFRSGADLMTANDPQAVLAISVSNPAVVQTAGAHGWSTEALALFRNINVPLLQNRVFQITVISPTTFLIRDAITGTAINGAALGAFVSGTVARVAALETPYTSGSWANLRSVQAETQAVLLNGTLPQVLTVTQQPSAIRNAEYALAPANFLDGPYLRPFPGSQATASGLSGVVTLSLSFQLYSASVAYDIGDYVTSGGQGYKSRTAANQGNTPASSPANWKAVNGGDPINNGTGFTSADIGRHVRLLSEPPLWDAALGYSAGSSVAYLDSSGNTGYWTATGSVSAGVRPGSSTVWAINATGAIWTWGRVLSVSASGLTVLTAAIGNLTQGGGVNAAFDGNTSKTFANSASLNTAITTYPSWATPVVYPLTFIVQYGGLLFRKDLIGVGDPNNFLPPVGNPLWTFIGSVTSVSYDAYVGGLFGTPTQISSVTVYPTTDIGFTTSPGNAVWLALRGKSTPPASPSDGVLLGTSGTIANTFSPVSIVSADQVTAYPYVWVEATTSFNQPLPDNGSHVFNADLGIAQAQFFAPNIANGSVIQMQIVGQPLLYSNAIRTWRLGVYGGANGWPTCGTYHDSRIWLSGVVGNRIDASKTGVIKNGALMLDFAPTLPNGVVADDNAFAVVADGPDANPVFWMEPDQQGILVGTQAGEWLLAPAAPGAMSPTNRQIHRVTNLGCANIEPARTDHTHAIVQKFQRQLVEYFADVFSGKFSAPNITDHAKHLTVTGLQQIAYQQELAPIIWGRLGDGTLAGCTYNRDSLTTSQGPTFKGWHRHTLGSGRSITSLAVGASNGGNLDSPYFVTKDAAGIHHIEVMTNLLDEGFNFTQVWFLDDGIAPSSFAISATPVPDTAPYGGVTVNGLWAHNGKAVSAYLAGIDCGAATDANGLPTTQTFTVANGAIFIPFGDGVSGGTGAGLFTQALIQPYADAGAALPGVVGFPFVSDGQIVRPATAAEAGTQAGPALGKSRRLQKYAAQLYGCVNGSIAFGTTFDKLMPAKLARLDDTPYTAQEFFAGIHKGELDDTNSLDGMLCWRVTGPHPAFVIAVGGFLHSQDE